MEDKLSKEAPETVAPKSGVGCGGAIFGGAGCGGAGCSGAGCGCADDNEPSMAVLTSVGSHVLV